MNRKIVINMEALKGTSYYNNFIEKARKGEQIGGKYLYREEIAEQVKTVKGKTVVRRYNYYYLTDLLKDSAEKILENIGKFFFKGKEKVETKKLDEAYKTQNIEKDYGADKKTWYQHCMEYLSHKAKWDKRFSNKDNAEKFKTPIKQKVAEKVDVPGMGTTAEETPEIKTTIETKKKEESWKPNPSLMRKVWSLYNDVKPSKSEIDVGDTIELNGRKGTVTKKVNNNMVMISFEDGGLGRFFKKDINKVEVSNESVANEADLNGKIQEITTGLNTSNDTVEETMEEHGNTVSMLGNQNAKKDYKLEDLENGTVTVKEIFDEIDNNRDSYTREERLAMQQIARDYINIHPDDFKTSHGYLETTDDWYVTEILDQRRKYRSVWKDGEDLLETKQTILDYAKLKSAKILQDINVTNTEEIQLAIADVKDKIQEVFNKTQSTDERVKTKGELDILAYTMAYQELLRKEKEYVEKNKGGDGGDEPPKNDAKKKFSDLTQEEKQRKKEQIQNNIVSSIQKDSVPYNNDGSFDKAAKTWLEKNNVGNAETVIGEVLINRRSVERDMHHGDFEDKYLKLQTLPAVKDVLEKGAYLGFEKDFELKNIDNHYFAAKINYGNEEKLVFCRVRENYGDKSRFYVHEVFTEDEIKKASHASVVDGSLPRLIGKPLYKYILQEVLNVNTTNDNVRNDGLTQDEADSLEYYVQDAGYTYINDKLRGVDNTPMENHHKEAIKNIDSAISKNTIKDKTLYRGISGNVLFPTMNPYENRLMELYFTNKSAYDSLPNDEWYDGVLYKGAKDNVERYIKEIEGRTFNDKGYVSTSKTIDGTKIFTDSYQNPIVIEFQNIPENTHGIDLSNFAEGREFKAENEVLLHRDLNYKITGSKLIDNKVVFTAEIIPESELEKHQNRSNAMLGNQNAAKPFSEEETKKEQKKVKVTREKAGLPKIGINYGERVSAMEDSVSLNPNAENYAYKDTGYIAGSQKEKIQDFWKRKKESGEGTSIEEIDWNTLEENPRYAEQQITKSNILGNIDYNSFKEKGMDSRAAYLASRVFAAIPKEPIGHDVTARKNYVIAINTVKGRFSECKTLQDVKEFVDDIYGEYKQTFDSQILRVPEVNKLTQERDGIIKEKNKIRVSIMKWCRNELVPKYKALGKKERKAFWRYREELKKEISEKIREFDPDYNNPDMYIEIDTSNMLWPINISSEGILQEKIDKANNKLKTARENAKNIIMNNNVTYEVWKELGDFADLRYSKTFQKHYNNLTVYDEKQATKPNGEIYEPYAYKYRDKEYDKYENWDWVDKKTNKKAKPESEIIEKKVKRTFEMIVPETIERVGGRNVSVKSTEELKKAFNFRDIQTGSYVQSDPVSAKWHIDNLANGFADLCDVLGIRDDQVSLNGRLALAVGARGHGRALAHYEPVERVINITKFKGGGSLGHEWFHGFDNMIAEAITGGNISVFMSDPGESSKAYRLHDDIPDNELAQKVRGKFINLVDAMMTGDTPETEVITYKSTDVETAKKFFEKDLPFQAAYYSYGNDFYKKLANAKTLDDAISVINERYKDTINLIHNNSEKISRMGKYEQKRMKDTVKNYEKYRTMAVAYFDSKTDKSNGGEVSVKTGRIVSRFYEDSKKLDTDRSKKYWSKPIEMAARAFEAYLVDKLKEKGRKNDYLSGHADNTVYLGEWFPYPTEKDRVKINKAFDELFEVIRNENAIRKSLDILKNREEVKKSLPLFFIKDGRFYIRKS